ncbi:guanine deaminase [Microbacterium terricola]|uniref:Guanine deaminase n=1 Tax=Microbacterium terricola TaxID=344163 RepID=A0ABM8DX02_9MICO|nr:guanine deaminase [Microbacterium terricola]UYK39150.1 guanine deaminase [Microbacterium terricola]BDV30135.1 guanine deaminase [Microbacterium terricola]
MPYYPTPAHSGTHAIRGHIVTLTGDPFFRSDALVEHTDGLIVVEGGVVTAVGPYADLAHTLADDAHVDHYPDGIITSGFIDTHVHYVQTGIIAAFGAQLIDWLNTYTFVAEQRFADKTHAAAVASVFFDQLLANGTTTALTFCAVYPESVDAFFEEASRRNMRMAGGKVLMDRNAPDHLLDTAQTGYDDSKALIEKWHSVGRNHYAVTPRFAPTSTQGQLDAAATLLAEHPTTLMHTHVSENLGEIAWVRSLFPEADGYLDVYDRAGLLRPGAVLAHGVHLTSHERLRVHETGSAISHCPTSNLFLGSGLFHVHQAKNHTHPVKVGLGTDIGAGTSFSLLSTMNEAYKVAQLTQYPLDAVKMLYLATLAGAEALGLEDRLGSIEVGKEADFVVLDTKATPLLEYRSAQVTSLEEQLFVLAVMGDDRVIETTYIAGDVAYSRDGH